MLYAIAWLAVGLIVALCAVYIDQDWKKNGITTTGFIFAVLLWPLVILLMVLGGPKR